MFKKIFFILLSINFLILPMDFGLIKVGLDGTKNVIIENMDAIIGEIMHVFTTETSVTATRNLIMIKMLV